MPTNDPEDPAPQDPAPQDPAPQDPAPQDPAEQDQDLASQDPAEQDLVSQGPALQGPADDATTVAAGEEAALSISLGAKLIVRFVRMHPGPFVLSIIGGIGWALMIVAASIVLGRVTDEAIRPAFDSGIDAATVWWAVAALVAVGALRGLSVIMRRWFGSVTEARMQRSLRGAVADRILEMPMGSYRHRPTGQLLSTSDVDVTTATQMLMPLPFSLGVVALVVVSLVSLWFADPWFALVAILLFPALAWLSRYYTTRIHEPSALVQQHLGRVASIAHESFDGVMVVKTLAREGPELERFDAASAALARERIGIARMTSVFEPLIIMLPNLGMVTLLLVGAARIGPGSSTTVGDLVQAVALFGWLAFPMRIVGFLFQSMPRAVVSIARVDEVLAEPVDPAYAKRAEPDVPQVSTVQAGQTVQAGRTAQAGQTVQAGRTVQAGQTVQAGRTVQAGQTVQAGRTGQTAQTAESERSVPTVESPGAGSTASHFPGTGPGRSRTPTLPAGPLSLQVDRVGFSFEGQEILRDVSFTTRPAEVLALVGSTGSGKSTLVSLLAHLDAPEEGRILLGGVDTSTLDAAELRRSISVAFQESYLFARSIADNVRFGRDISDTQVRHALARAMATEFVDELPLGVDTVVGERGVTLSGGQRQRVALARALAGNPRVVIADDATSAVDPVIESQILESLREGETTMLVVAHRLSTITLADRVVHFSNGTVRAVGTHEELLGDPEYVALVTAYEDDTTDRGAPDGPHEQLQPVAARVIEDSEQARPELYGDRGEGPADYFGDRGEGPP